MNSRHHRLLVTVVFALAVALRVAFVVRLPHLPLYWDEVHYNGWAKKYADAWGAVRQPRLFLQKLRVAFEGSIQKGEAYSAFAGLVYAVAGHRPKAVFIVQALLDALTCLFVYGIARELGGRTVALVALVLSGLYEPFIFSAARLQTETLCSFVFLAGLYAFLSQSRHGVAVRTCVAGFLVALAMLARPALQFLFPLLLVLIFVVHWDATRARNVVLAVAFSAGFFLLIGPRLAVTTAVFGHPIWSGTTDPSTNVYAAILYDNLGWRTDHNSFASPPKGELLEVLGQRELPNPPDPEYRRATVLTVERHPIQSGAVLCHKIYQAWAHPYNDSHRRLLFSPHWQQIWHKAMLVLAAIGCCLALDNWRIGLPLVVATLYVWSTYLAVQIEVRYVVTALPVMLCFAALALERLGGGLRARWQCRRLWAVVLLGAATLALIALLQVASIGRLLALVPVLSPTEAHHLRTGAMVVVMVLAAALVFTLLRAEVASGWAVGSALVPLSVGTLIFLVGRPLAGTWRQWQCPLTAGHGVVRQEFQLPMNLPPPARAEVRLDLVTADVGGSDLVVTVNGNEARRFVGGPKRDDAVPTESFYNEIFAGQGRGQRPWHSWYAVPIAPARIAASGTVQVDAKVEGKRDGGDEVVTVFGDYPGDGAPTYEGPSVLSPGYLADTSVYKYVGDGDFRMRRRVPMNPASRSSFFDGQGWSTTDLSFAPGRQFGRYRIFLVLTYPNGIVYVF
jgi:4-amino-4-deoxy-L-arabinose transferase-like glycosyltransferase